MVSSVFSVATLRLVDKVGEYCVDNTASQLNSLLGDLQHVAAAQPP